MNRIHTTLVALPTPSVWKRNNTYFNVVGVWNNPPVGTTVCKNGRTTGYSWILRLGRYDDRTCTFLRRSRHGHRAVLGANNKSQLGDDTTTNSSVPVAALL